MSSHDIKLPQLPGFTVSDPAPEDPAYHKTQTLLWKHGYSVICHAGASQQQIGDGSTQLTAVDTSTASLRQQPTDSGLKPNTLPKWLQYEGQVLRFYAYFKEQVPHSKEESWRVRKVLILFYLENDTVQVVEPREDGSGLVQGTLVARQQLPKQTPANRTSSTTNIPTQTFFRATDFSVGQTVTIYSRSYSIVDADPFTREFLSKTGHTQPNAVPYPTNPIDSYRAEKQKPSGLTKTDPESPSRFAEALMGRAPSTKKLQQFLEGNTQVLRFYAVWDDDSSTDSKGPVRIQYKLHYFLEDDTVEVVEFSTANDGREFHHFLKRAALPKSISTLSLTGSNQSKDSFYRPEDLIIGATIDIFGRQFLLHDADNFTKSWMKEHLFLSDDKLRPVSVSKPASPLPVPQLPPHNGIGRPEDTRQNCLKLTPKPPKKDYSRFIQPGIEHEILRFTTRLVALDGRKLTYVDANRRFVLSFYVADDSIGVHEPPVANSGVVGGKFLERGKVYKPASETEFYSIADVRQGAQLTLHGRVFELLEADAYTQQYLQKS